MTDDVIAGALVPLAAHGLAGSTLEVPRGPFAADEWFRLVRICRDHGLLGMLASAAEREELTLSAAQAEELSVRENEAAGLALLVEQRVVRLSGVLSAASVAHRVLGGPARARLGYHRSSVRTFETATVLVEPRGLGVTAPRGVGVVAALPVAEGLTIELADLADPPMSLAVAGHSLPTASVEEHLVLACLDVAGSWARDLAEPAVTTELVCQRDVAELALSRAADATRVQRIAERWGVVDPVAGALVEVWRFFGLADRTRLSVWATRVAEPSVGARRGSRARRAGGIRPDRNAGRVGRIIHKLSPSARKAAQPPSAIGARNPRGT